MRRRKPKSKPIPIAASIRQAVQVRATKLGLTAYAIAKRTDGVVSDDMMKLYLDGKSDLAGSRLDAVFRALGLIVTTSGEAMIDKNQLERALDACVRIGKSERSDFSAKWLNASRDPAGRISAQTLRRLVSLGCLSAEPNGVIRRGSLWYRVVREKLP